MLSLDNALNEGELRHPIGRKAVQQADDKRRVVPLRHHPPEEVGAPGRQQEGEPHGGAGDEPAVAQREEVLRREEAEGGEAPERPRPASSRLGPYRLAGVLDDGELVLPGDGVDRGARGTGPARHSRR